MSLQSLAVAVIRQAVDEASLDGDHVLALAHDPHIHWHSRHKLRRIHQNHVQAVGFLRGSQDLMWWASVLGIEPTHITTRWIYYNGQKGLTER